ncbi:MAG: glycosyltransferase family 4 protein [Paludibacteraceae bacterium]|nr:glycosyltransferase family 4 protein [Paludibacteraceae bacterium]
MKILYLYRNSAMGYSIGKVFAPIETTVAEYEEVDSLYMPAYGYSLKSLLQNISVVRKKVAQEQYDVIHITGQENYLIPFLDKSKLVVTVHDLDSIISSEHGIAGRIKHLCFINTISSARYLTCISEKSKKEVIDNCKVEADKITVIPNCVDSAFSYSPKAINKKCPTILHIGVNPNKNLKRTISALQGIDCHLRIVGPKQDVDFEMLNNSGIDYSLVSDLSNDEILQEYRNCDIVNFPSLYEGFGMPIIEGQAIGRTVVTSNISPMKEVAGDGAVLVDPKNVTSMHNGYIEAIHNSQKYIQRGLENVRRFEVSKIVKQYLELYHNIIELNRS